MVEIKRALRREHLAARRALRPEELAAISAAIVARLRSLPELSTPQRPTLTLLLYAAQPDEVDPAALALGLPLDVRVVLPRVVGDELELVERRAEAQLVPGAFGILEPPRSARLLDPVEIDVAVVPGVAFDVRGGRLGRGGGFYDRLLPRLRPDCVVIGLAPERAVLARVPTEPHDRPVDLIVTDASVRRRTPTPDGQPA
jgi:5-formyltetrahydrofolate cyclo-ligase